MKKLLFLILLLGFAQNTFAQDAMNGVIKRRATEMHRVITLADEIQWEKFIAENYSQALIEKSMNATVRISENDNPVSSTNVTGNNLKEKAKLFQQLHTDFGDSKILSMKPNGENLDMVIQSHEGLNGTFKLKFQKKSPYLIDGLGIEVH